MFNIPDNSVELKDVPVGEVFEINAHFYMKTNEVYHDACRCVLLGGREPDLAIGLICCILKVAKVRKLNVTMNIEE